MVKTWINTAGPLLGAGESQMRLVGGDPTLYFDKIGGFGLHFDAYKKAFPMAQSLYEMLPHNTFETFANADWLKDLKIRMDYEKNPQNYEVQNKHKGVDWFPDMNQNCADNFKDSNSKCKISILNMSDTPFLTVKDENYSAKNITEGLKKYGMAEKIGLWVNSLSSNTAIDTLQNPEIPVVLIYTGGITTNHQLIYKNDPKTDFTDKGKIAIPDSFGNSKGDGTVQTSSSLTPLIKWAYEFKNSKNTNFTPMKVIEFCSSYNMKNDPYDKNNGDNLGKVFTKNEYIGQDCSCRHESSQSNGSNCTHGSMLSDQNYVNFISNSMLTEEISLYDQRRKDDKNGRDVLKSLGITDQQLNNLNDIEERYIDDLRNKCLLLSQ